MPTVDDLTISLTIKDNSNLDKLRQNLDAVVKTGGVGIGVGTGGAKGTEKTLKSIMGELNYLRSHLLPSEIGNKMEDLQMASATLIKNIEEFGLKGRLKNLFMGLTPQGLKGYFKDYGLDSKDDLQDFLDNKLDLLMKILQDITEGKMDLPHAWKTVTLVKEAISKIQAPDVGLGRAKDIFNDLVTVVAEYQKEMEQILTVMLGGSEYFVSQFKLAKLKREALDEETVKKIREKINTEFDKLPAELRGKLDKMVTGIPQLDDLEKIFGELGYSTLTNKLFDEAFIKQTPELKALALTWLERILDEGATLVTEPGGAMHGYIDYLNKAFQSVGISNIFGSQKRLDILVTDLAEKLTEFGFTPSITGKLEPLELKRVIGDLIKEKGLYYGLLGRQIKVAGEKFGTFRESPQIEAKIVDRMDLLKKLGETYEFNLEKLDGIIETIKEKQEGDTVKHIKAIDKKIDDLATHGELKKLMGEVSRLWDKILEKEQLPDE